MFTVNSHVEDGWQTTRVRILQASWGMAVDLTARSATGSIDGERAERVVRIAPTLTLDVTDVPIIEPEVRALTNGLRLMAWAFPAETDGSANTIHVRDLTWTQPDYQPEVTTIAMSHWVAAHLNVQAPTFDVVFDRATDRYWVSP